LPNYALGNADYRKLIRGKTNVRSAAIRGYLETFVSKNVRDDENAIAHGILAELEKYYENRPIFFDIIDSGRLEDAMSFRDRETNPHASAATEMLQDLIKKKRFDGNLAVEKLEKRIFLSLSFSLTAFILISLGFAAVLRFVVTAMRKSQEQIVKATGELAQSEMLFRAIVENIPVAVFLKDIKDDFRVTLWNKCAESTFEVPRTAIIGKSAHDLWPTDQADLYLAADRKVASDRLPIDIEEEPSQTKSRGTIYLRTRKVPLVNDEAMQGEFLLCISEDVTELKRSKEALDLERVKSLRSAKLASLGEMSAGIAHEINNPLAIIVGSIGLLKKTVEGNDKIKNRLDDVERASRRIAKIVSGLRKFSRSSDEVVEHEIVPIGLIITEALTLTEGKARQFSVAVDLASNTKASIRCAEIEIEQVLINLINNAIDAVQGQPKKWVRITAFEQNNAVVVQIRDSGLGIPEKVRKRLFEPFFTTKPIGQGTGLGLSITKGILDDHRATIEVLADDPNTCFEIRFPGLGATKDAA